MKKKIWNTNPSKGNFAIGSASHAKIQNLDKQKSNYAI